MNPPDPCRDPGSLQGPCRRVGLSCRMPWAARWQHETGEEGPGPGQEGQDGSTALGDQVRSPGGPAPHLHHSTGLSPRDPRLPQAGGPPKEAKSVQPLLASCSDMVIPPGLRDSPAPHHSVTLRPTLCSLEATAHFRLPVALGPSPSTQSAGPKKPSGSAQPLFTHPHPSGDLQAISGLRDQYWAMKHVEWRGFSTPKERPGPGPSPRACHSQPQAKQG